MNLSTQRIWCYSCKSEVFIDGKMRKISPRTVVYNENSDNEQDNDRLHTFDRESYDSGRGSYATLRTDTSSDRRNSNVIYAFDRGVGLNVGMSGDSGESSDSEDGELNSRPRGRFKI